MDVVRWTLLDVETNETYTVQFNPNKATGYRLSRNLSFTRGAGGRVRTVKAPSGPKDWTWGGVVRTKEHHDALIAWSKKKGKVRVTDHLGRTFEVMMKGLNITDRRPVGDDTWRFVYEMSCMLLRRIA